MIAPAAPLPNLAAFPAAGATMAFWQQAWTLGREAWAGQLAIARTNGQHALAEMAENWAEWMALPWQVAKPEAIRRAMMPTSFPALWSQPMLDAWVRAVEDFVERDIGLGTGLVPAVAPADTPSAEARTLLSKRLAELEKMPEDIIEAEVLASEPVSPDPVPVSPLVVDAPKPEPLRQADAEPALLSEPEGEPDDLTRIKGIGAKLSALLNSLGIFHFRQIAGWSDEDAAWIDNKIDFSGRVAREKWREQAASFLG